MGEATAALGRKLKKKLAADKTTTVLYIYEYSKWYHPAFIYTI
jgi:hypothetical protein